MNRTYWFSLLFFIADIFSVRAQDRLTSGSPIPAITLDGIGVLSPPGIHATPLGTAYLKHSDLPSMFVAADSRYAGIHRYDCIAFRNGVPVFGSPVSVAMPDELGTLLPGSICQKEEVIYAYWLKDNTIYETRYDQQRSVFEQVRVIRIAGLPRRARSLQVTFIENRLEGFLEIGDGVSSNAPVHWVEDRNFAAYGPDGIFVGNLTYSGLYGFSAKVGKSNSEIEAIPLTGLKEVMWGYHKLNRISYSNQQEGVLTGSVNGNFLYYPLNKQSFSVEPHIFAVDKKGIALRHVTIGARPVDLADERGRHLGLIVGGEGGIYYYPYLKMDRYQKPVYDNARPVLGYDVELYGGSLVVPNVVDWNGDGKLDIIAGNSAGHVLYFENFGSNEEPAYGIPECLAAGGQKIHIQPGYNDDIQGPYESRWGYVSPTVVDWDGDGLLDIVSNDSRGKHRLFLNAGSKTNPSLLSESPIYLDGLELHGTWRTRPGAGMLAGRMAYITQDAQDQFHLYWQMDTYNVVDGGKLRLEDGSFIDGTHFPNGGGSGRNKILLVDWDGDGVKDLLIGTPRHGSIPEKGSGMPFYHGNNGAAVVFLKNVGTEKNLVFAYPSMIKYKGRPIHFGQHSCAPAVANLGEEKGLNLVVGTETGRFIYYERSDLSW